MEAQLAQITVDDLRARTDRMDGSGVPVWWPTNSDSAWIGEVPPDPGWPFPALPADALSVDVAEGLPGLPK
ncbi:hypothetical protein [Actinopolymorpha pittospori]|uniref:Uncharacterized protein n=1 Tax=Actinopolymorpha pittospori TaxID=648752 RepID=A0A927MRB8_9ACTN|nr:hypothetical protein [Actinopolymorpha pittospori]MBE1604822.1 hypothetical protein [Actinopolymorpha pittospori]